MNPSAKGWIKKLLSELPSQESVFPYSLDDLYNELKICGFIYGTNLKAIFNSVEANDLTHEELCKVNMLLAFDFVHKSYTSERNFVDSVTDFYNIVDDFKSSFFQELFLGKKKSYDLLESMINKRIAIDDNVITKNFNYLITNTLLFVDVLAYEKYLQTGKVTDVYLRDLEATIETIIFIALDVKKEKTKYDQSLIKLFESSFRYEHRERLHYDDVIKNVSNPLTKYYIIDLVCMTFWTDTVIDEDEQAFLHQLAVDLEMPDELLQKAMDDIRMFYEQHKDEIALLKSRNMIQSFYENSSSMVKKLINRNKKRLATELYESKELMILLTQSTTRSLSDEEQKRVKEQLLDIFKSIPSLAIFMLPGGMLLLPIVIKYIPNILPSGFDDNRLEETEEDDAEKK
ncbi:LETM1-like protein [Kordia periserrulae]|uniref:LETM1-like protein n=1 Tax=Kordia periserrulae TaxID=701523 RepID=A0A2T6C1A0_9FLAO|nr:LETM1-related biofilm-associated protein [Kordia periserrulae]PTX62079.1 LETM1-like protein [Kordia periserrulae]